MARRSQCSSAGDNPLDPNYLPPHYREEYRLAVDALVEEDVEGYYEFLQRADVVDFLSPPEIAFIQESVQVPKHSSFPEHRFPETGGDGSSDTYWPIHSDLDAPGLDLGWPQLHHFTGPTEVTTLVNPPEPDMPSIKEQARRLIKNAQQVIAIVMDRFTDVDIFADILNAAMRNIAVYVLLDEQNAHHFLTMVSNCRVNLQSIQFLRVRTVPGITYHCRSGKSFKGQMMDRFLLTDCRAVLSGNYSFMWSFEKLHRSMAHLFLGQLVSTFDEEFRILFAQSHPLTAENMSVPMENVGLRQKKQHAGKRAPPFIEPRKFLPPSAAHLDEWERHSYDERMMTDWRMMSHKRQETPVDLFARYQPQMDPHFDQGHPRTLAMENPAKKRHSFAEGGRHLHTFLQQQQALPDLESRGRQLHKGQQPNVGPGAETNYTGYDKYWSQDYQSADQYSEPGLPQEMEPSANFDPVLNYLSSTRNVDFDQTSEKFQPGLDLPFSSSNVRRLSAGHAYMCQTSPPASNTTDDKQFFPEPIPDRKDPMVKRGLRNWRISSYLSAFENPGDEGLPLAPPQGPEPFDEPSNPVQQPAPGVDMPSSKIPNVREFKVPALPRASQMQSYVKMQKESSAAETKTTPSPSESSSTTEGDKPEEGEPKELNSSLLRREDSFRRKYNVAVPRSSRLRSSLIFTSLEQNSSQDSKTTAGQPDEDSENEQNKLPFVSQVLSQRRLAAREPFEWSRYIKSATFDNSSLETSKPDDGASTTEKKDSAKDSDENPDSLKAPDVEKDTLSESVAGAKASEPELPKTDQPVNPRKPLFSSPANVDMNDADNRLRVFKELAAKRKAAKAAEAEKAKEKSGPKKDEVTVKTEDLHSNKSAEKQALTATASADCLLEKHGTAEDGGQKKSTEAAPDMCEKTNTPETRLGTDPSSSKSCESVHTSVHTSASTDSEKIELRNMKSAAPPTASAEPQADSRGEPQLTIAAVEESQPPAPEAETPAEVLSHVHPDKSESPTPHSTSQEPSSLTAGSPPPSPSHPVAPSPPSDSGSAPTSVSLEAECPHNTCAADSDPDSSSVPSTTSPEESCARKDGEQSEGSEVNKADSAAPESCSTHITGVEGRASEPDPEEPSTPTPTQADPPHERPPSDVTSGTCQTETLSPSVSTSKLDLSVVPQSPPPPDVSEKTQTNSPLSLSSSDATSSISETPADTEDVLPSPDSSSSSPAEPRPPNKSPDSSQISPPSPARDKGHETEGSKESEAPEPAEKKTEESESSDRKNKQETVCKGTNEQTEVTPDDAAPTSPQSKQPKGRYHSSTANVLSSSNLRDDTKLLLEQISASSQSRSESAKEAPVTDDEKEDEADKNAKREKERRNGSLSRGQTKTSEEREKLLERIQSMRKDKKVYSRFEMAP